MTRRPVTRAQVERILELGNSAHTLEQIAAAVGVPHAVVKLWLERGSLHGSPDWDHGDFHAPWREASGVDEETLRPKYGPEYQPLSARTGRETAQETAMRAFGESIDGIPVKGYTVPGLWDSERERAEGPRKGAHPGGPAFVEGQHQRRSERSRMTAYVEKHSAEVTVRLHEIYAQFWLEGRTYGQIALRLGCHRESVVRGVRLLRKRMQAAGS